MTQAEMRRRAAGSVQTGRPGQEHAMGQREEDGKTKLKGKLPAANIVLNVCAAFHKMHFP